MPTHRLTDPPARRSYGRHVAGVREQLVARTPFLPVSPTLGPRHTARADPTSPGGPVSSIVPAYARLPYWREVLDRAARNATQTVIPVLISAVGGTVAGLDPLNVLGVAGVAALVSVLKALAGVTVDPSAALVWRLTDRALPAAAATGLSFLTVDGAGWASVEWDKAGIAVVAAALIAVAQAYVSPAVAAIDQ